MFFNEKNYFKILVLVSLTVLISAFVLELFFNHPPCMLCIYQRIPYFCLLMIAFISFFFKNKRLFIYLSLISLLSSGGISIFHSLVERKLVNFEIGCTSMQNNFSNIEDLRNFLEKIPIIKCDEITFSIMGLSLANMNLIISLFLISLTLYYLLNYEKNK
tara:strand:+ start:174 stop:653 length:480 start_codon:yes stop_codon:yes gene_type:complete